MKCPNCGIELVGEIAKKKCPKCHYNMITGQIEAKPVPKAPEAEPTQTPAPAAPFAAQTPAPDSAAAAGTPAIVAANPELLVKIEDHLKSIRFWVTFWSILSISGAVLTLLILLVR